MHTSRRTFGFAEGILPPVTPVCKRCDVSAGDSQRKEGQCKLEYYHDGIEKVLNESKMGPDFGYGPFYMSKDEGYGLVLVRKNRDIVNLRRSRVSF